MTNDDDNTDTYEYWVGPVRSVIRCGGGRVPLTPPRPGETEPAAYTVEPDILEAMDIAGRPVESVTLRERAGRGEMVVKFSDGEETVYDQDQILGTPTTP